MKGPITATLLTKAHGMDIGCKSIKSLSKLKLPPLILMNFPKCLREVEMW